jgi:hypothetical protein
MITYLPLLVALLSGLFVFFLLRRQAATTCFP